jgi:hypothetical protein
MDGITPIEPPTSLLFRVSLLSVEVGDVQKSIIYATRFPDDKGIYLAHAKADLGDVAAQLDLLAQQLGTTYEEVLKVGKEHISERYKEFAKDKWKEA